MIHVIGTLIALIPSLAHALTWEVRYPDHEVKTFKSNEKSVDVKLSKRSKWACKIALEPAVTKDGITVSPGMIGCKLEDGAAVGVTFVCDMNVPGAPADYQKIAGKLAGKAKVEIAEGKESDITHTIVATCD